MAFEKPVVAISKCVEFGHCRYNGDMISSDIVKRLKDFFEFVPVCPEVESGLAIPRDPTRLITVNDEIRMIQPKSGKDITKEMTEFSHSFFETLKNVCGFILKYRSPSCGISNVKLYQGKSDYVQGKTIGLFACLTKENFPLIPLEDEGRLRDFQIRERFLTRVYTLFRFYNIKNDFKISKLIRFHSEHKYLLMVHNEKNARAMGKLLGGFQKGDEKKVFQEYEKLLKDTLRRNPKINANINMLTHALGYFSKRLSAKEKAHFLKVIDEYKDKKVPFSGPASIIQSWIARFEESYLENQYYWGPYPKELIDIISDSGKGKTYQ